MSQYTAAVPDDGQVRPEIRKFFERFYEISDNPNDHEIYATYFTKDGRLIMGPTEIRGRDGRLSSFPLPVVQEWTCPEPP